MTAPSAVTPWRRARVAAELALIFFAPPVFFYFHATRWNVHLALWVVALCALFWVCRTRGFSWRTLWHGVGWKTAQKKIALARFCIAVPLVVLLTLHLAPGRLFMFPIQRPWFWLLVMILYPILSVVPQEFLFRSFMFRRYRELFGETWMLVFVSALSFAFVHVVFHNWVSPVLSFIAGLIFASSYSQHRSLKWAALEHAAYGCMVFTVGIGFYFLVGGYRHV